MHPPGPAKAGVLLVNLGTPDAPTPAAVRRYLKEFLSDPLVVEIPRLIWWPILNGIILNVRPKKSAAKYASIWTGEGSPLAVHTRRQARLLTGYLGEKLQVHVPVAWAMRYGNPSIRAGLDELKKAGCARVLLLPLYPQFSGSATGSALAEAVRGAALTGGLELREVRDFHDHPGYIAALAASVRAHWAAKGQEAHGSRAHLLMSFHGLPQRAVDRGDPYQAQCLRTGRLLADALQLRDDQWTLSFQSRFGRAQWLQPYTTGVLEDLAGRGVAEVDVLCPGFVSDCLETLEEIGMEEKAAFLRAGGRALNPIPCLNERQDWINALVDLVAARL